MNSGALEIDVRNLQFIGRGETPLLPTALSFKCAPGRLVVLTGGNGTGKTTILDVLTLRKAAPAGSHIGRRGHTSASDIAYLPQILTDVLDICIGDLAGLAGRQLRSPHHLPLDLGKTLAEPKREIGTLSGGQRQLFLFWLVAQQRRRIFVYDEPFRHMDATARRQTQFIVEKQVRSGNIVILTDHTAKLCWRVECMQISLDPELDDGRN